jgi:hypothetical protein
VSDLLVPGSLWRDRRPEANKEWLKTHRRVVEVKYPGSSVMTNDRVTGVSFWQGLRDGEWVDIRGRRHTSILRHAFLSKFEHVRGPEPSPEVQR